MSWLRPRPIIVYTDGSCLPRKLGGHGGWAAIIKDGDTIRELTGFESPTTNNRMEMLAVIKALEALPTGTNVYLYTDSQYVQKGIQFWLPSWKLKNWRTVANKDVVNQDLWKLMDEQASRHMISWHWVKGHADDPLNIRCDELAREAGQVGKGLSV